MYFQIILIVSLDNPVSEGTKHALVIKRKILVF